VKKIDLIYIIYIISIKQSKLIMTPFVVIFICVIGVSLISYGTAKMRGKVYGFPRQSAASRKKQELLYEKRLSIAHKNKLDAIKINPVINFWQSDFRKNNPDNFEFCHNLNTTWFHGNIDRSQKINLSKEDLQKIKDMYIQQVYTPRNFPITWRDMNTWKDERGNKLFLEDISEEQLKDYYFKRCPQPPVDIGGVLYFLAKVIAAFFIILIFGTICS
jgi:hypothetical protein